MAMYHGPNTIMHFNELFLDTTSAEIIAPALFRALSHNITVGDLMTDENHTHDDISYHLLVYGLKELLNKDLGL